MRVLSSLRNSLISETSLCDYTPNLISSLQHEKLPHTDLLFDFPPLHPTGANSMGPVGSAKSQRGDQEVTHDKTNLVASEALLLRNFTGPHQEDSMLTESTSLIRIEDKS